MSVTVPCEILQSSCSVAHDCRECKILQSWDSRLDLDGFSSSWECADCVSDKARKRFLPGYYTECECEKCGKHSIVAQMVVYERS